MQLVQRWWNGRYGRLARRDVWLEQHTTWTVRFRQGDGDSPTKATDFQTRAEADALVQRLLAADPNDDWRDITTISTQPAPERSPSGQANSRQSGHILGTRRSETR